MRNEVDTDAEYNKFLSRALGLNPSLDFMNNRNDIRLAESVIKERGMEKEYFKILSDSAKRPKEINDWKHAQIEKPYRRAASIRSLLNDERH